MSSSVLPARRESDPLQDPTHPAKRLKGEDENPAGSTELPDPGSSSELEPKTAAEVLQIVAADPSIIFLRPAQIVFSCQSYCTVCRKKTNHEPMYCPDMTFVFYDGCYRPNYCRLCNDIGHVSMMCPFLDYGMEV